MTARDKEGWVWIAVILGFGAALGYWCERSIGEGAFAVGGMIGFCVGLIVCAVLSAAARYCLRQRKKNSALTRAAPY